MNETTDEAPRKAKVPRRRQQITAVLVSQVIKSNTPAPIDDVLQAIRGLADRGLIDPEDGLVRDEFSRSKAVRNKKALSKLREMGLGKAEIQVLTEHFGERAAGEA